jgi:hypothetical protein
MTPGGSKRKGGSFERVVCKQLSLWVTNGGREDVFARSSLSGGRATQLQRKGKQASAISGDIAAVHEEGYPFIKKVYVECKHIANANFLGMFLYQRGKAYNFWQIACDESFKYSKYPWLVIKQNRFDPYVVVRTGMFVETGIHSLVDAGEKEQEQYHWQLYKFEDVMKVPYDYVTDYFSLKDPRG